MADITNNNPLGKDSVKGGYFFNSNLTPAGTFPNLPTYTNFVPPVTPQSAALVLTLEQVKEELKKSAALEQGTSSSDVLSESAINTYLTEFVDLLINYTDLRNYVFFGSAYTELVYHIDKVIGTYPYRSYFARDYNIASQTITLQSITGGRTRVGITSADIIQQSIFTYDASSKTNWTLYDLIDKNSSRFPIVSINESILISNVTNVGTLVTVTTATPHNLLNGEIVTIAGTVGLTNINTNAATITLVNPTTFTYIAAATPVGTYLTGGTMVANDIHIIVEGNISLNNLIEYQPTPAELFKGLVVCPKIQALTDFEVNLPGEQSALLSTLNPTPWPRDPITNNIITEGITFDTWVETSTNMVPPILGDDLGILSVDGEALNLRGALALDEHQTNQLLRRAIPDKLIDELNDTDDKLFTRFVLIAGRFFDTIKTYIDFLKYVHSLNYSPFDQLSPEFYKLYAEHYGFELFDDDSVDLAKAIIRTEPGLRYDISDNAVFDNLSEKKTLKELQDEKQKRLLLNLLHLYKTKGTQRSVKFLTSLLGAPEGLVVLNEFFFNTVSGLKEIDNEKYHVPAMGYEIDPQYLKNPSNIFDPINLPYVYRLKLDNETNINLREIKIVTDPQGAIADQIIEFGKTIYPYALFRTGSFANLQEKDKPYLLLPLCVPDKYTGLTIEYMIPKGGYPQLVGTNNDEVTIHLGSLYEVDSISYSGTNIVPITPLNVYQYIYPIPAANLDDMPIYPTDQWQNQIADPTQVIAPSIINRDPIANQTTYIIARLEGNDLVIRAQLRSETLVGSPVVKRVAIYKNVFAADGLNHQLRIIYRPEGVEVYQDFTYLGLARWINPTPDNILFYEPIDAPKELFDTFIVESLPELFAYPGKNATVNDNSKWYDLMVGLPQNIEMYIGRVAIFDSLGIEVPDILDFGLALSGIENEKFSFNLQDQILNGITKEKDLISIECTYRAPNPDAAGSSTIVENYLSLIAVDNKISLINLTSKNYRIDKAIPISNLTYNFTFNEITITTSVPHGLASNNIVTVRGAQGFGTFFEANEDYFNVTISVVDPVTFIFNGYNPIAGTYTGGGVVYVVNQNVQAQYVEDVQGFYKMPNGVQLTIDNLFTYNAWSPTIHKDYNYDVLYNEAYHNYESFSNQVLTYLSLIPFIELIEAKFQTLIKQFIPIVINLGEFGRLLRNNPFNQLKAHYTDIHFQCDGSYVGSKSVANFNLTQGTYNPSVNYLQVSIGVLLPITVDWISTNNYTLIQLANALNTLYSSFLTATATYSTLVIEVDSTAYYNLYSVDIVGTPLVVTTFGDVVVENVGGFIGGDDSILGTCDKFVVTRTNTYVPTINPTSPYIYYDSENGPLTYIYNDSESLPPLYIE